MDGIPFHLSEKLFTDHFSEGGVCEISVKEGVYLKLMEGYDRDE